MRDWEYEYFIAPQAQPSSAGVVVTDNTETLRNALAEIDRLQGELNASIPIAEAQELVNTFESLGVYFGAAFKECADNLAALIAKHTRG